IWDRSLKKFFFPQSLLNDLLGIHDYKHLSHDKFINYQKGLSEELYEKEIMRIKIRYDGEIRTNSLPYKEIINYTNRCDEKNDGNLIKLDPAFGNTNFHLPAELLDATDQILYDFKQDRPGTKDNPAIGIHLLEPTGGGGYKCQLKKLTYFDAVRTNQTLDTPLDLPNHMHHTTIRDRDARRDTFLNPFSKSILANQIGVSAVWYMHCPGEHHKERLQFFLKGRKSKLGVFTKMMGTISGMAQPPKDGFSNFKYLEEYATSEMLRIFSQTTNIGKYLEDHAYSKQELRITKLAFTRELMRGGLPQFFFLIKTPYISSKDFSKCFKDSPANRNKYRVRPNILTPNMSPETVANFLFAFRHLQRNRHLDYIDLDD
ncbi:MAG: hypothetical protein K2H77_01150, partial [Alistipes sp.]|nr:hypothetical protein [Alistipes sp.]